MKYNHTALKEAQGQGQYIQYNDIDDGWVNIKDPLWDENCEYRIKPSLAILLREAEEFRKN